MGFVGNYAPVDFHHRLMACPSYTKKKAPETLSLLLLALIDK